MQLCPDQRVPPIAQRKALCDDLRHALRNSALSAIKHERNLSRAVNASFEMSLHAIHVAFSFPGLVSTPELQIYSETRQPNRRPPATSLVLAT
jgi:hypothetical protein